MSDFKELLKCFDSPQIVEAACRQVMGQSRHYAMPAMIKKAVCEGLLVAVDNDGPVDDGGRVYSRDLCLTDIGREFCGLPPVRCKQTAKPESKTLFD